MLFLCRVSLWQLSLSFNLIIENIRIYCKAICYGTLSVKSETTIVINIVIATISALFPISASQYTPLSLSIHLLYRDMAIVYYLQTQLPLVLLTIIGLCVPTTCSDQQNLCCKNHKPFWHTKLLYNSILQGKWWSNPWQSHIPKVRFIVVDKLPDPHYYLFHPHWN